MSYRLTRLTASKKEALGTEAKAAIEHKLYSRLLSRINSQARSPDMELLSNKINELQCKETDLTLLNGILLSLIHYHYYLAYERFNPHPYDLSSKNGFTRFDLSKFPSSLVQIIQEFINEISS